MISRVLWIFYQLRDTGKCYRMAPFGIGRGQKHYNSPELARKIFYHKPQSKQSRFVMQNYFNAQSATPLFMTETHWFTMPKIKLSQSRCHKHFIFLFIIKSPLFHTSVAKQFDLVRQFVC